MSIDCPSCGQGIEESKTYVIDKLFPRSLFACPHCQTKLTARLSVEFKPWLQRSMVLNVQFVCVIGIGVGKLVDVNNIATVSLVCLGVIPLLAGIRDRTVINKGIIVLEVAR